MKTIRSLMTLVGLSLLLSALAVTVARAQNLVIAATEFSGSFTLPFEAQWGSMTLPAGDYTLSYGRVIDRAGAYAVAIAGEAKGGPHGVLLVQGRSQTSATKDALVCARGSNTLIVRALEMAAIGQSVSFAAPRGAEILAQKGSRGAYTQLAEAPMLIQRVPVKLNGK
ncbi:MAG: hypothetical protein M1404_04555 [Acidobacteria bacterium]|nr:hypothetical protein [Acidobacteriota bacterium]